MNSTRRVFVLSATAVAGAALSGVSQAQVILDEKDTQAAALGYVADFKRVDAKKYPKYAVGQNCTNCSLYTGKAGEKQGGCPLFGTKLVASEGWCSAWVKKPS